MAKVMISKAFSFDAAHRLVDSYTKACQNLHGHTYHVQLFLSEDEKKVDENDGVVMDFRYVKEVFQVYISNRLDHKTMLRYDDDLIKELPSKSVIVLDFNPTAENIARYIYSQLIEKFDTTKSIPTLVSVRVYETPSSWAQYPQLLTGAELTNFTDME